MSKITNIISEVTGQYLVPCPVCGTKRILKKHPVKKYYLDGIPQMPLQKYLEQYGICSKCGCIYYQRMESSEYSQYVVQSADYQDILHANIPIVEKKLKLMQLLNVIYGDQSILLSHYYRRQKDTPNEQKYLNDAIQYIFSGPYHPIVRIDKDQSPHLKLQHHLSLCDDIYIIDLYRRTGQFNKGLDAIVALREREFNGPATDIKSYLAFEEQLIQNQHSQLI